MHDPNQTLSDRIREARGYTPRLLAINTTIAIVLSWTTGTAFNQSPFKYFAIQMLIAHTIGFTIMALLTFINLEKLKNTKIYFVLLIALFGFGGALGGVISKSFLALFGIYINFGDDEALFNLFTLSIIFGLLAYGYFYLTERLKETAADLAKKEVNEERLQRATTQAQLGALRARINPHFLFNTLNSIAELIHEQPDHAEDMVTQLAALLRAAINSEDQHLTLQDELQLVQAYLDIEKVRLGSRLQYELKLPPELQTAKVPALLIQPLVENSVIHGISPKRDGGKITVTCSLRNEQLHILIQDTGKGWQKNPQSEERFGLASVQERLRLHYQEAAQVQIHEPQEHAGVHIAINLPLRT